MGTLRLVLAISVAYAHAGSFLGFPLVPADTAVQIFYVISGFYMALVLNEKYLPEKSSYRVFIASRFLRLYPIYATVLLLTLVPIILVATFSARDPHFLAAWRSVGPLDWWSTAFLVGSQIILLGQDWAYFLSLENGGLAFTPNYLLDAHPLYQLLVIPQAWTLGVEFSFYLIAPFIVRRSRAVIVSILAISLSMRVVLQVLFGLEGDPWSFRFFPSELALFLVGALGYRVYRRTGIQPNAEQYTLFCAAVFVGAALLFNRWDGAPRIAAVCFLVIACLLVPRLFKLSKANVLDRHLGELSYPIYISHITAIWFAHFLFPSQTVLIRGSLALFGTVMASLALYLVIDRPVDRWRQALLHRRGVEERAAGAQHRPAIAAT